MLETNRVTEQLTQVLPVLRLQSNLQELVLKDNAVVLANKPGIDKRTITQLSRCTLLKISEKLEDIWLVCDN